MKRETGKDRWRRVPKDYFKTRDGLQGAKLRLSAVAALLSIAWVGLGVDWKAKNPFTAANDGNSLRANHGTLARVHSAWDTRCDACHVPFEPIDGRSMFASTSTVASRSGDKLCMSCHAGPAHQSAMIEAEVKGCAGCHHDHQGRDFSLIRLADNECTNCHGNLSAHVDTGKKAPNSRMFANVARFNAQDHPPFAPEAAESKAGKLQDKGRLKFNHALHMAPGLVRKPGETPYTVGRIPLASEQARYQGAGPPDQPVQLDCASCHRLDSTEIGAAPNPAVASNVVPVRSPGGYYLPVTYEAACRACHVLNFDPGSKETEAPHGVQPDQVADFLKRNYAAQVLSDDPKLLDVFVAPVKIPGKTPVQPAARKRLDDSVAKALAVMFPKAGPGQAGNANNCLECHYYGQEEANGIPTRVEPTRVPQVWFTHAAFNHSAHKGVSCRDCHAGSYALMDDGKTWNPDASRVATDVLLPGIDNCVQCHAPAKSPGGWFASNSTGSGGVSFDCTECHRYHNGDRTLQGPGASAQDATVERSLIEFLKGEGGRPAQSSRP